MIYKGSGIIQYDPPREGMKTRTHWWCIVRIDRELTRYYRWWIDKEILNPLGLPSEGLKQPSWDAHVSVIRGEKPPRDKMHLWKKYHGKRVEFFYEHVFWYDIGKDNKQPGYFFTIDVQSSELTAIRQEFGFKADWNFHVTFGRTYKNCSNASYGTKWMHKEAMIV